MKLLFKGKPYESGNSIVVRIPKQLINEGIILTSKKYQFEIVKELVGEDVEE
jgi:hypothetical protein